MEGRHFFCIFAVAMKKIIVAGIGPGSKEDKYYFQFIEGYVREGCECIDTGMKKERERAEQAFAMAEEGKTVVVISSGDAGLYGMAPLVYEMARERRSDVTIETLPGISAFQKAASLLGAPVGHDVCIISLSDLMTPWEIIERRIVAAAEADFVTAVYNPKSHGRYWQLYRLQELMLQKRKADTPVGYVRQAGRAEQEVRLTTLGELDPEDVDMFTVVLIGNSQSFVADGRMITPRGYYQAHSQTEGSLGSQIMMESFRTIRSELHRQDYPLGHLWALLVTMALSGIRKGALKRLGIEAKCYLGDPRTEALAATEGITRTQAGIRLAVEDHPDALFAFGNAPTALMELCDLVRKGKARPAGIIAAPVGFVHVKESKHMVKPFRSIPKVIVEGRKGGSNLAATLCNAILTFDDAAQLKPGRDV